MVWLIYTVMLSGLAYCTDGCGHTQEMSLSCLCGLQTDVYQGTGSCQGSWGVCSLTYYSRWFLKSYMVQPRVSLVVVGWWSGFAVCVIFHYRKLVEK